MQSIRFLFSLSVMLSLSLPANANISSLGPAFSEQSTLNSTENMKIQRQSAVTTVNSEKNQPLTIDFKKKMKARTASEYLRGGQKKLKHNDLHKSSIFKRAQEMRKYRSKTLSEEY